MKRKPDTTAASNPISLKTSNHIFATAVWIISKRIASIYRICVHWMEDFLSIP